MGTCWEDQIPKHSAGEYPRDGRVRGAIPRHPRGMGSWGCSAVGCPHPLAPQISCGILPAAAGGWFAGGSEGNPCPKAPLTMGQPRSAAMRWGPSSPHIPHPIGPRCLLGSVPACPTQREGGFQFQLLPTPGSAFPVGFLMEQGAGCPQPPAPLCCHGWLSWPSTF